MKRGHTYLLLLLAFAAGCLHLRTVCSPDRTGDTTSYTAEIRTAIAAFHPDAGEEGRLLPGGEKSLRDAARPDCGLLTNINGNIRPHSGNQSFRVRRNAAFPDFPGIPAEPANFTGRPAPARFTQTAAGAVPVSGSRHLLFRHILI